MDKKKITSIGGAISAVFASVCCVGPVVLAGLGISAGGIGFVKGFGKFHTLFMILTFVLLGSAFYFTYRERCKPVDQTTGCCPAENKKNRIILWIATVVAILFLVLPFLI